MEQETGNNEGELHESHGVKLDFKMFNHQQNLQAFTVCMVEHLKPSMPLALYASIPVGNDHHVEWPVVKEDMGLAMLQLARIDGTTLEKG
jgi:hypothetical protein